MSLILTEYFIHSEQWKPELDGFPFFCVFQTLGIKQRNLTTCIFQNLNVYLSGRPDNSLERISNFSICSKRFTRRSEWRIFYEKNKQGLGIDK